MKEGKRGYWIGKKKDKHTINRLSESKHKKILQYDLDGNLVKIWDSAKDAAKKIFKDYKVINGSAESKIYSLLQNKTINKKQGKGSYWFKITDIMTRYGELPIKISISQLYDEKKIIKRKAYSRKKETHRTMYSIIQYNENNDIINTFKNVADAVENLNMSTTSIKDISSGRRKNKKLILKYGEKSLQPIMTNDGQNMINYSSHSDIVDNNKNSLVNMVIQYMVIQYNENGEILNIFNNTQIAAEKLNMDVSGIRKYCRGERKNKKLILKYGKEKINICIDKNKLLI